MSRARNEQLEAREQQQSRHVSVAGARPRPMIRKVGSNVGPLPTSDGVDMKRTKSGVRPAQTERGGSYVGPLPVPRPPPPKTKLASSILPPALDASITSGTPTEVYAAKPEPTTPATPATTTEISVVVDVTMPLSLAGAPRATVATVAAPPPVAPRTPVSALLDAPRTPFAALPVRALLLVAAAVTAVALLAAIVLTVHRAREIPEATVPRAVATTTVSKGEVPRPPPSPAASSAVPSDDVPVVTPTSLPVPAVDVKSLPPALPAWATAPVRPKKAAPAVEPSPASTEPAPEPAAESAEPAAPQP